MELEDGRTGIVTQLNMRSTTLETYDGKDIVVPNEKFITSSFTNWTHSNSILRTVLYVGADYKSDPEHVLAVIENILTANESILEDPSPMVILWEYGDSSINYRLQYYLDMETASLLQTRTEVLKQIWHQFKENNIQIPFPQRELTFINEMK